MSARPTEDQVNSSNWGGTVVKPNDGKRTLGWLPGEAPPASNWNWFWNLVFTWIGYLDTMSNHVAGAITGTGQTLDTTVANGDPGQLMEAMRVIAEENAIRSGRPVPVETNLAFLAVARGGTSKELVISGDDDGPLNENLSTSDNGIEFADFSTTLAAGLLFGLAASEDSIVACGVAGSMAAVDGKSSDSWTNVTPSGGGVDKELYDVIEVTDGFLTVGKVGRTFRAPDPVTGPGDWVAGLGMSSAYDLKRVAYDGAGTAIAVGEDSGVAKSIAIVRTTDQGLNWAAIASDGLASYTYGQRAVAYGNGVWVVACDGRIQASFDGGLTFATQSTGPNEPISCMAWTGRLFVAPSVSGDQCWVSADGINWRDIGQVCAGCTQIHNLIVDGPRLVFVGELTDAQDANMGGVWITSNFIS